MVAGYHLIWTVYGAWLPNDPRGSTSSEIRAPHLEELGELHHGRKKIQPCSAIIRKFYVDAKKKLKHDLLSFNDEEVQILAAVFEQVIQQERYTCYGCALMPDHVHILIRKHRDRAEDMIAKLQETSWERIMETKRRPSDHPVWGGPGWKVYLETAADIERTIRYIRANPLKARLPAQTWAFVKEYDGWLPGVGTRRK